MQLALAGARHLILCDPPDRAHGGVCDHHPAWGRMAHPL